MDGHRESLPRGMDDGSRRTTSARDIRNAELAPHAPLDSSFKMTCEMLDRVPDLPLALLHLRER